jgi:DNA repair protein RadC
MVHEQVAWCGFVHLGVVRAPVVYKATVNRTSPAVLVAHGHPTGDSTSVLAHLRTTERRRQAGELLDLVLVEQLVVDQAPLRQHARAQARSLSGYAS